MDQFKKILIVGNLPPPLGGVSMYVRRRIFQLKSEGFSVQHIPSRPKTIQLLKFMTKNFWKHFSDIEINSTHLQWIILLRLFFPAAKITVIDHNDSRRFKSFSIIKRWVYGIGFLLVNKIDLVREGQKENYKNILFFNSIQFGYRLPFILPSEDEEKIAISKWPKSFLNFIEKGELIVSCAYNLSDEKDIYRFKDIIKAFGAIEDRNIKLILTASLSDDSYENDLKDVINSMGLKERVYFHVGELNIWPIFRRSKLLLRITTTDGDSVSVREAMSMGCRVIATNVVKRPEGVILVPLNNVEYLTNTIINEINIKSK